MGSGNDFEKGRAELILPKWESFFSVVYPANPSIWRTAFAPIDGLKSFLTTSSKTYIASYITEAEKAHHHSVFGDDYSACLNWYKRGINNLGVDEEKELLKKGEIKEKDVFRGIAAVMANLNLLMYY